MVVCAVICEPVSIHNSLLTGKLTGYFAISGLLEPFSIEKLLCRSGFSSNSLRKLTAKKSWITGIEIELTGKFRLDGKRPFLAHLFGPAADAIYSHRQFCRWRTG